MSVFYEKKESNWWFILGLIAPVGLVLYFVWRESIPARAKKLALGAICCVIAVAFVAMLIGISAIFTDPHFSDVIEKAPEKAFLFF